MKYKTWRNALSIFPDLCLVFALTSDSCYPLTLHYWSDLEKAFIV